MSRNRNSITALRAAAFIKRLATLALTFKNTQPLLTVLALVQNLLVKSHAAVWDIMEYEEEDQMVASGEYDAVTDVPEQSNALSSKLWEVAALSTHYDANVRLWAKNLKQIRKSING